MSGEADAVPPDPLEAGLRAAFGASAPAQPEAEAATELARPRTSYQLLGELARGGMGVVLKGHDPDLGRDVALKVLQARHTGSPEVLQRFVEEAQIGGQLQHPGIVPVYEMGVLEDSRPFFSMKLIQGRTLAELFEQRPAPDHDQQGFLRIFEAVCQTLAYAHSRGVVHRDVKPSNVMVGSFGEVQVVDWGLAKVLGERAHEGGEQELSEDPPIATVRSGPAADEASESSTQSVAGSVLGTPAYMSPEQAQGKVHLVDERSDVFALGAVLCTLLTGEPPYRGERIAVLLKAAQAHLSEAFERLDCSGAAPELIALAKDCLAEAQHARPRTAARVAASIHDHLTSVEERARAAQLAAAEARVRAEDERRARRLTLALACAVIAILVVGGTGWTLVQQQRAEQVAAARRTADQVLERARGELERSRWDAALAALAPLITPGGAAELSARLPAGPERDERLAQAERLRARATEALEGQRLAALNTELFGGLEELRRPDHHEFYPPQYEDMEADFAAAFEDNGLILEELEHERALALLGERGEPEALAALIDEWAHVRRLLSREDQAAHLTALSNTLDPDPRRTALRDAMAARDLDALRTFVDAEDFTSLSAPTLRLVAHAMEVAGDRERQIDVLRRAQKLHRADFLTNLRLARMLVRAGEIEEALPYYEVTLALRPESVEARHLFGIYLHQFAGRAAAAAELFQQSVDLRPDDAHLWYHLGQARLTRGEHLGAIAALERSLELEPAYLEAHGSLGEAHLMNGDLVHAEQELRAAHALDPEDDETRIALGTVLIVSGEGGEGERLVAEALANEPRNAEFLHKVGWAYSRIRDWARAQDALEAALEVEATRDVLDLLSDARAYQGDFPGAVEACDQSLALGPTTMALLRRAALANRMGDVEGALERTAAALELDWTDPLAHSMHAGYLTSLARWTELSRYYSERLARAPDSATELNNLGWFLVTCPDLATRDPERALEHMQRAVQFDPQSTDFWNTLALVHVRRGDWTAARTAALELQAEGLAAELNTLIEALAEWHLGNPERARALHDLVITQSSATQEPTVLELREELRRVLAGE